ncbi:TRAP transporter substrate-binding protein DctP [Cognatishimia sp. 1_MG-2023]|uniref:TRAP transporter substrate-binding protein n=1 Tax=Cognatishimia sp. 1_MG-2023 TaxID=3062642 RepID=UPI0026E292C2|nr:TRAP transporter substrate-binding protein DctP [Cognatishimia sp. 1_MG-2023]MDO6725900.1 TRAP transporter substrate-binding protein DctP [Cognatishimia sp. 1_MG-2023]
MKRRQILTGGVAALGGAALAAPAVASSEQTFKWKMTTAYPPSLPMYSVGPGSLTDLTDRIRAMSGGRLNIEVFHGGELVPPFEGFDAAQSGIVECNGWVSYFGAGKRPWAQFFGGVPFGMNYQGQNAWMYEGGGLDLWQELYADIGMVPFPCGNTGVQMTGWFKDEVNTLEDLKGLQMRIPGLSSRIYAAVGVDVKLLPPAEIFPALERGVIQAAEWVGPAQDKILGLHNAASYYYTTGWSEPNNVVEFAVNKDAWETLPEDLQHIVRNACASTNVRSQAWSEAVNGEALQDLVENHGTQLRTLSDDILDGLREATPGVLEELGSGDPLFARVRDHYFDFKAKHDAWTNVSEGQWHRRIRG